MGHRNTEGILTGLASHNISNCFKPFLFLAPSEKTKGSHISSFTSTSHNKVIYILQVQVINRYSIALYFLS